MLQRAALAALDQGADAIARLDYRGAERGDGQGRFVAAHGGAAGNGELAMRFAHREVMPGVAEEILARRQVGCRRVKLELEIEALLRGFLPGHQL